MWRPLSRPGTDNGRPRPSSPLPAGQVIKLISMNISCQHNISYKVQILTQFANFTDYSLLTVLVQIMVVIEVSGLVILSPDWS